MSISDEFPQVIEDKARNMKTKVKEQLLAVLIFLTWMPLGNAADLKMRIKWEGETPKPERINNPFKNDCRDVDLNEDRQFVDADTMGVRDAVVYVAPLRRDRDHWRQPPRKETVSVTVCKCRIRPHILTAQAGDSTECRPWIKRCGEVA